MAIVRVPTTPGRSVQVAGLPGQRLQYAESRNLVGKAMEQAGGALGEAADAWAAIKAVEDDAAVKKLDVQVSSTLREELWTGDGAYFTKQGMEASNAREDVRKRFDEIREQTLSQATNPRQREMMSTVLDKRLGDNLLDVAKHATVQLNVELERQSLARIGEFQADAVLNAHNPERFAEYMAGGFDEIDRLALRQGWTGDRQNYEERKFESGVIKQGAETFFATNDIDGVLAFLDRNRSSLLPADMIDIEEKLSPALRVRAADELVALTDDAEPIADARGKVTFTSPVKGGKYTPGQGFGASRGKSAHNGVDIAAPVGSEINPIAPGKVVSVSSDGRSGKYVVVDHGGGYTSSYSHMGKQAVAVGDRVDQRTVLGAVGMTGRTSGPHLHLVVKKGGQAVDPKGVLGTQTAAAGSAATRSGADRQARLEELIKERGLSPEMADLARQRLDQKVARDQRVQNMREEAAMDDALAMAESLGDSFTSPAQIPGYSDLSPRDKITITNMAESNAKGDAPVANSTHYAGLSMMAIEAPDQFLKVDLRAERHLIAPNEIVSLAKQQAAIRAAPERQADLLGAIRGQINLFAPKEMKLAGDKNKQRYARFANGMLLYVNTRVKPGEQPSRALIEEAFHHTAKTFAGASDAGLATYDIPSTFTATYTREFRALRKRDPTIQELNSAWKRVGMTE